MAYNHSFACYPTGWRGTVVSPTKICLQFEKPQVKLRVNGDDKDLMKLPTIEKALPVVPTGVDISCVAVGCQLPEIESLQTALLEAYKTYYNTHKTTYSEKYGKEFKDYLTHIHTKLTNLIKDLD